MPHVGGQKYKILNEYQILMNESDEQHQINAIEMTRRLGKRGQRLLHRLTSIWACGTQTTCGCGRCIKVHIAKENKGACGKDNHAGQYGWSYSVDSSGCCAREKVHRKWKDFLKRAF